MISWFWFFSVIVAGVLGFFISLYFNLRGDSEQKLKQDLEALNSEYQNYQDQVRSHFNRTGELLAQYQQQHQQLQSHIFSASQSFINPQREDFSTISTNENISKADYVSPHLLRNKTFDFEGPAPSSMESEYASDIDSEFKSYADDYAGDYADDSVSKHPKDYVAS